jgi:hypothetical protein
LQHQRFFALYLAQEQRCLGLAQRRAQLGEQLVFFLAHHSRALPRADVTSAPPAFRSGGTGAKPRGKTQGD